MRVVPFRSDHLWMFSCDVLRLLRFFPLPVLQLANGQFLVAIRVNLREHIGDDCRS